MPREEISVLTKHTQRVKIDARLKERLEERLEERLKEIEGD